MHLIRYKGGVLCERFSWNSEDKGEDDEDFNEQRNDDGQWRWCTDRYRPPSTPLLAAQEISGYV